MVGFMVELSAASVDGAHRGTLILRASLRMAAVESNGSGNRSWGVLQEVSSMKSQPDYEVLVVGAGGAGLAAAISAAEVGRSVLIVEAARQVGGSTALSGGSFMAAGTSVQAAAGYPSDTADAFFDHYLTFNRWAVEPAVARRFCDAALPTFEWLTGLGVKFTPEGLYRATREPVPRSHRPVGAGQAIVDALHAAVQTHDVDIALGHRADTLLAGHERSGFRLSAGGEEVTAAAVVLTTGGFGQNLDLVRQHLPDAEGEAVWSPSADTCRGDGLTLAGSVGAATAGRNHGDLLLTAGLVKEIEPFAPPWLMMVGGDGRRFVDESAPYAVLTPRAIDHGPCWVILDDPMVRSARPDPARAAAWGSGTWTADTLLAGVSSGQVLSAGTLEQLAVAAGLPGQALAATVRRYNGYAAAGRDEEYLKTPSALVPVATPPFYAVRVRPSVVALTGYGLRIDPDARVLRAVDGDSEPGLYAAGEVTGNVLGPQYLGGGNAIGSALIFGRIAGRSAAHYLTSL
jgi:fumarate reductase flavoprotein subunit